MKPFRIPFFALALGIALIFAFLLAGPVFAQDELPAAPAEPAAVETVPAVEEAAPVEEPMSAEEPPAVPVEEPLVVEEPAEVVVEEVVPPVEEPVVEESPEIVALDEGGAMLPLASEEASDTVATGDPYFKDGAIYRGWSDTGVCAAIVLPVNCTLSAAGNALRDALDAYATFATATGPIYLEADTYILTGDLTINGANPNYSDLTGLIGTGSGGVTLNFNPGFHMMILNAPAGFTLQGMKITGSYWTGGISDGLVTFMGNSGNLTLTDLDIRNTDTNGDGLDINGHTGNVTMSAVKVNQNGDEGAMVRGTVTGKVTVTNSSFDDNGAGGSSTGKRSLSIQSNGAISLNGVSASDFSRGDGAWLSSQGGITVKNSLFNYNNDTNASDTLGYGLRIASSSKGAILLDHVYANNNQMAGIKTETSTGGAVTMTTVEATYNNQTGIEIDNCRNSGTLCATTTAGAVSLSNLTLNNRYGNLYVIANGAITLNNVNARSAYGNEPIFAGFGGIILHNQYAKAVSAVTVNNTTSSYNTIAGIKINSRGAVTLNHVTAEYNYYGTAEGIDIETDGTVTFLSTLGKNTVYYSNSEGVKIRADGAVSISKLSSTSNDLTNLDIDNRAGSAGVTITTGDFSGSSGGSGLRIYSDGAITLTDVDATGNIQDGIYLDNSTGAKTAVTIKVTGTNINYVSNNQGDYGLYIRSMGAISVAGIHASNNDSRVVLDNAEFGATVGVTVNGLTSDTVNDIGNVAAVRIYSNGAITASNLTSEYSPDQGFFIDNSSSSGTPGITLTGVTASYNNQGAMTLYSNGAVKITNLYAGYQTGGSGVEIHTSGSVTIDKTPTANTNRIRNTPGNGLTIYAGGAVVLKDTNVTYSGSYGAYVTGATTVSVTNCYFNNNTGGTGLEASASGAITLTNSSASNNGGYGVFLNNPSSGAGVTVTGSSTAGWVNFDTNASGNMRISTTGPLTLSYLQSSNSVDALSLPNTVGNVILNSADFYNWGGGDTVRINSTGTVTVTDVRTHSTSGSGLVIDNTYGVGKSVTITDFYDESTTSNYALQVESNGVVTLTDIDVDGGGLRDYGVWVNNSTGVKTGVTMKISNNWRNEVSNFQVEGIYIQSSGQVTLDELFLDYNPLGLYVNTGGGVTVTDSEVRHQTNGMQIIAGGAVVLTNFTAVDGTGLGVSIDNSSAAPATAVTISKMWVGNNDTGGLRIDSAGAVTITDLYASGQDVSGYALDIDTSSTVTINSTGANYWEWNDLSNSSGTVSGGTIHAGGNISLTGINAGDNTGGSGLIVVSDNGTVTIKNSRFSWNNVNGLTVMAMGAISLTNVDAEYNTNGYGALLDNIAGGTGGITVAGATTNFNRFYQNDTIGLDILTAGAVTLNYVDAGENPVGIRFPAPGNRVGSVSMNYVSVTNNSVLSTGYGLLFESIGTITLSNIDVRENFLGGVKIDNSFAATPKAVTLTNIYSIGSAGDYGLYVHSKGAITTKNIRVDGNSGRQYGIWLDNAETGATGGVTITPISASDWGYATEFTNIGLNIESNGAVSMSGLYTYDTLSGVRIENRAGGAGTGGVTINNVNSYQNVNEGVFIRTNGNTALSNMQVFQNGGALQNGIDIQVGETPSGFSGTVTLTNITAYENRHHEVYVHSHRQITAKNLSATDFNPADTGSAVVFDTDGGGVSILDPLLKDYEGAPVNNYIAGELTSLVINASGDVILQRLNAYSSDTGHGIQLVSGGKVTLTNLLVESNVMDGVNVDAVGAISLTGVTARNNNGDGAFLINDYVGSTGGVTITSSTFDNNNGASPRGGLFVQTNGAVLFNQVSASNNSGDSALVVVAAPSTTTVTINKSVFNGNNGLGLVVQSQGNITINGITANDNTGTLANGVTLDNSAGTGTVTVLATLGANTFNINRQHGLAIYSSNAVVINNVTASENRDGVGIGVNNTTAAAGKGTVTITTALVKLNELAGIAINSDGAVTLSSIECISNGVSGSAPGIDISTTSGYNVLVQNSVISGNGKEGIRANLIAGKTLTVKKTFYMGNGRTVIGSKNLDPVLGTLIIVS